MNKPSPDGFVEDPNAFMDFLMLAVCRQDLRFGLAERRRSRQSAGNFPLPSLGSANILTDLQGSRDVLPLPDRKSASLPIPADCGSQTVLIISSGPGYSGSHFAPDWAYVRQFSVGDFFLQIDWPIRALFAGHLNSTVLSKAGCMRIPTTPI
jgi:hypothetical protein